ncbi:sialidase family protein [Yinghuangia seranimata]|uniref:sialidase family protein n=1 Tax=Yinghuangia seranimata TaxID=408067 RepID=UPI00248C835F|nr:sialidase family protein [Yinghuangia seranimata]MDI2125822.1 sialidase family protein [Yinghuangia seranimata]
MSTWPMRMSAIAIASAAALVFTNGSAGAVVPLIQISTDPFTTQTGQHAAEVEPDTFSFGSTEVAAFQVGRINDGGATDTGFATSTDNGATWTHGLLPGVTKFAGGGIYDRATDASVAYDAKHATWIVSSLGLLESGGVHGAAVVTSRSTDGGLTWTAPTTVATGADLDKNWTVCDNTPASPFYGNCYTQWDDHGNGNRIKMSTSSDGAGTWGAAKNTGGNATGIGGQPVVQPNGTVIVPMANAFTTSIRVFRSTNGGSTWSSASTISSISGRTVAGGLRTSAMPSAEIDASGKVYVVWQDCRFRASGGSCTSNDIVMSTSTNGTSWSAVTRIPIDATSSTVDHFIPGIAVDPTTSGATAKLSLTYYYYPVANCTVSTCQLNVGQVSSTNGGSTWTAPTQLAGPMSLSWLPGTTQGPMVGDYISSSFLNGKAFPVFMVAAAKSGSTFNQAAYTPSGGVTPLAGSSAAVAETAQQATFSQVYAAIDEIQKRIEEALGEGGESP